jgi:flagellar protein FlgJ
MIDSLNPASLAGNQGLATRPKDDPAKVKEAAKQFEALLIGQMMKSMQPSDGVGGEDGSSSCAMEYGQEAFAQALSANGGLGLATLVAKGLKP